jgi:murein DD-endopeptidase MepM/ murein hydrolase activator NlpD
MRAAYAVCMIPARIPRIPFLLLLAAVCHPFPSRAQAANQTNTVLLTPAVAVAGSPELIRVSAPNAQEVSGEWLGRELKFFQGSSGRNWYALAGLDVEAPVGGSTLKIEAKSGEEINHFDVPIEVHPAQYRTESISVAPQFVEPNAEELKQIEADNQLKAQIFSASAPKPLWLGSFRAPVIAPPTDSFGVRRTYNGKLASIHKGMDFRAHMGTPVRAANSGVVVLARRLYYEGNCVIVDHGLGLYTVSMHLSRIDVHEGQQVSAGDQLGLSGATGRVTGPHLHWAVRWEGAYLDPAKLLRLKLDAVR